MKNYEQSISDVYYSLNIIIIIIITLIFVIIIIPIIIIIALFKYHYLAVLMAQFATTGIGYAISCIFNPRNSQMAAVVVVLISSLLSGTAFRICDSFTRDSGPEPCTNRYSVNVPCKKHTLSQNNPGS